MKNIEEIYKQKFQNFESEISADAFDKFSKEWHSSYKKPWYKQSIYQGVISGVLSSVVILLVILNTKNNNENSTINTNTQVNKPIEIISSDSTSIIDDNLKVDHPTVETNKTSVEERIEKIVIKTEEKETEVNHKDETVKQTTTADSVNIVTKTVTSPLDKLINKSPKDSVKLFK